MTLPVDTMNRPTDLREQVNGELDPALMAPVDGGEFLHHGAAWSWSAMRAAAADEGVEIAVGADAYRPLTVQIAIWLDRYIALSAFREGARFWRGQWWVKRPGVDAAAIPGTSNHGWGLAVDVARCQTEDTASCRWLKVNARRFGWSAEIQSEPWHWRAVHGDTPPPTVTPQFQPRRVATPRQKRDPGDDDMLIGFFHLPGRAEIFAAYRNGTKTWIPDQETLEAAQALAGFLTNSTVKEVPGAASMRAFGPILGPVPPGVDAWGVPTRRPR